MKQFAKPRIARALGGMVCAAAVTPGMANDSPCLGEMPDMMPRGSGDVPADAQCGGVENCQAAKDGGRRPVIEPRSYHAIEGDDAKV